MWPTGSKIIAQFSKYEIMIGQNKRSLLIMLSTPNVKLLSGSRGPDGPDLQSPFGRKFQLSVQFRLQQPGHH